MVDKDKWKHNAKGLAKKALFNTTQEDSLNDMIDSKDTENLVLAKELIRLKISDALIEDLNDDQKKAFLQIITFFREGTEDAFLLKGYAGTGKTFLVKRIIEWISLCYNNRKIAVTAPTNKAVHVLAKNSPFSNEGAVFEEYGMPKDKIVFTTIHKLVGLKERITDKGEQLFVVENKSKQLEPIYHYLFLDEVSMLPDQLFFNVMSKSDKIKIVFFGDPAQIPPVNKTDSKVLSKNPGYNIKTGELRQIMRQKGEHPIVDASMILRDNLLSSVPIPNLASKINDHGKGIIILDGKNLNHRARVRVFITRYFKSPQYANDKDHIRILAWTNKTVNYLNGVVRTALFGENIATYVVGDTIIANKPLFEKITMRGKWNSSQFYAIKANSSDEFIITKVDTITRKLSESGFKTPSYSMAAKYWALSVTNLKNNKQQTIYVIHEDDATRYAEFLKDVKSMANNAATWSVYYNILKWSDNINYNYAITVHKSQGSTYKNVIFIEEDLNKNRKIQERNRIKYTAYTRAEDILIVLK